MRLVRTWHAAAGHKATASQEAHAQRSAEHMFRNLSLPIDISSRVHVACRGLPENTLTSHFILPSDWIRCLMGLDASIFCGDANPKVCFQAFWEGFRLANPNHKIFQVHSNERLEQAIPLLLHGDEGRGQKKSPFLIMSMESPVGCSPRLQEACGCKAYMDGRPDLPSFGSVTEGLLTEATVQSCLQMYTNFRGHSYLTRHVLYGQRASVLQKNPHVLNEVLQIIVDDFNKLMVEGIEVPGHGTVFAAIVGCKGDMDFHVKSYKLSRCYSKVQSRDQGFICHACLAAAGVNSAHNFDDFRESPDWEATMYSTRPFDENWPILANLPIDDDAPERAIVGDTLHIIKLGLARDLVGGIIIILLRLGFWDYAGCNRNLTDRLSRAHSHWILFCRATKEHPSFRSFTKKFFHIKNFLSAPWTNSKGSDSLALLRYCSFFAKLNLQHPTVEGFPQLLSCMHQTCESMLDIFRIIHAHKLFLERACAARLYISMMRTLRGYKKLGRLALSMNYRAFILKPKAHALHHIGFALKKALEAGHPIVLSPEAHSCEVNEDLIGRISRLSRRVGPQLLTKRVLERYLLKKRALIDRHQETRSKRRLS